MIGGLQGTPMGRAKHLGLHPRVAACILHMHSHSVWTRPVMHTQCHMLACCPACIQVLLELPARGRQGGGGEAVDSAIDLSGDTGAVGRILVTHAQGRCTPHTTRLGSCVKNPQHAMVCELVSARMGMNTECNGAG